MKSRTDGPISPIGMDAIGNRLQITVILRRLGQNSRMMV